MKLEKLKNCFSLLFICNKIFYFPKKKIKKRKITEQKYSLSKRYFKHFFYFEFIYLRKNTKKH